MHKPTNLLEARLSELRQLYKQATDPHKKYVIEQKAKIIKLGIFHLKGEKSTVSIDYNVVANENLVIDAKDALL